MAKIFRMIGNALNYAFSRVSLKHDMFVEAALISRPWNEMM